MNRCIKYKKRHTLGYYLLSAFVIMAAFLYGSIGNTVQAEENNGFEETLYARAAVLMDAESGRILYGKNEKEIMPMASTTKIMTCIVALENGNPDDIVKVSNYASKMPKVKLNVREGENYRLGDLLYSLMLESHNDSAVVIAEHIGGSVEGFAKLMNQKARDIGCYNTYFITPNGLDAAKGDKIHSTTAEDLARIMSYCITKSPKKNEFLEITQTATFQFTNKFVDEAGDITNGSRSFSCNNLNAFLTMMEGALSGKTGFTGNAGDFDIIEPNFPGEKLGFFLRLV